MNNLHEKKTHHQRKNFGDKNVHDPFASDIDSDHKALQ